MAMYTIFMVILGISALVLGFQTAHAGGYVDDRLAMSDYGMYYTLNMNPSYMGVSMEVPGNDAFAVEHFTENVLTTYWNYVNVEYPSYNGYLEVTGFENIGGDVNQLFFIYAEPRDVRRMPIGQFVDTAMQSYYGDDFLGRYTETYMTYPDDYYISRTGYTGTGVVETEMTGDWMNPNDLGPIMVTRQSGWG